MMVDELVKIYQNLKRSRDKLQFLNQIESVDSESYAIIKLIRARAEEILTLTKRFENESSGQTA